MNDFPKRGDIYWVRFDPSDGKEIKKTRPCLVISSDIANQSELIVVAPIMSTANRVFPSIEVKITLQDRPGKIILRQMRCIDKTKRLGKKLGSISQEEIKLVDAAIKVILGL